MKKKAFTLIELILVLAIISILSSIMILRFNIVEKLTEKNEINMILSDINFCKQKARVSGLSYSFAIKNENSYSLYVEYSGSLEDTYRKDVDLKLLRFENSNDKVFTFKPSGSVSNADSLLIYGKYRNYNLKVGVSGANIRIE